METFPALMVVLMCGLMALDVLVLQPSNVVHAAMARRALAELRR